MINNPLDVLHAGKRSIALDLKKTKAVEVMRNLCKNSDVLIEPFRPGVMEKLGLSPEILLKDNPRLIYARLTGFGSDGKGIYSQRAGHDINYIAVSGLLSMLGRKGEKPLAPLNFAADFAGGGLLCSFGICLALLERHSSGKGQIVDCAMVEGAAYVASWLYRSRGLPVWTGERGENVLDSGSAFYDTYETKDGKWMSVGALEPQFYQVFLSGLGLDTEKVPQYGNDEQNRKLFTEIFRTKTQHEWCKIFDDKDACVLPVLNWNEAPHHEHNKARNVFLESATTTENVIPNPAPKLSRTPGKSSNSLPPQKNAVDMAMDILGEIGMERNKVKELYEDGILLLDDRPKL